MNRKEDCRDDYCDCPCHRGKLIDGTGKRKVRHTPGQCPCRDCRHCQKRVKSAIYQDHISRCPENYGNSEEAIAKEEERARREAEGKRETKKIERETKVVKRAGEEPRPPKAKRKADQEVTDILDSRDTDLILRPPPEDQ